MVCLTQWNKRLWLSPHFIRAGSLYETGLQGTPLHPLYQGPHHSQQETRQSPDEAQGQVALCRLSRSAAWDFSIMNSNQVGYLFRTLGFPETMIGELLRNFKKCNWLLLLQSSFCTSDSCLNMPVKFPQKTLILKVESVEFWVGTHVFYLVSHYYNMGRVGGESQSAISNVPKILLSMP